MATKVTVLGEEINKDPKPIEFVEYLVFRKSSWVNEKASGEPKEYDNIVLVEKDYLKSGLDLMLAKGHRLGNNTVIYLGHFNSGTI